MKEFQNRQKLKNILYSPLFLIGFLFITALIARGAVSLVVKERQSAATLAELQKNNQALKDRQASLTAEIAALGTQEGVEQEVREKFNATKPGEHLAVIVEDAAMPAASSSTLERIKAWWQGLADLFR